MNKKPEADNAWPPEVVIGAVEMTTTPDALLAIARAIERLADILDRRTPSEDGDA